MSAYVIESRRGGEWAPVPAPVAGEYAGTEDGRSAAIARTVELSSLVEDADFRLVAVASGTVLFQLVKRSGS